MERVLTPTPDPAWVLHAEGFDPLRESSVQSRFAISNGLMGIRGARSTTRGARWVVPPRTYVAGLFDTASTATATSDLVPAADWLEVRILLPSGPLVRHPGDVKSHRMALDLRRGCLLAESRQLKAPGAAMRLRTLRLVSLSERAIGLQLIQLDVEDGEVDVTLEAAFAGADLGLIAARIEHHLGVWRTHKSGKALGMAVACSLRIDGHDLAPIAVGPLQCSWNWRSRPGQIVCFERVVATVRSDAEHCDPGSEAQARLGATRRRGWQDVVAQHEAAWVSRWKSSDVEVDGDPAAQQALRFAIYHLNGAANPDDELVSIGARALTGDDYHGHVFWDTEIYLLPFYILTWPQAARALLMYRFHTLDGARAKAARMGWRGALYAWESADTGAESSPEQVIGPDRRIINILCGKEEQHISADVAYAVWQYWQATADESFLLDAGAEILLETGRFWSSRAQLEADGSRHIRGVIGPDEYHQNIDDNAFTNVMARWNIRRALDVAALLRERWPARWASLSTSLGLDDSELAQWREAADTMATGLDTETGLYQQFAGYFTLEPIDLAAYAGRSVPMDVVLGPERTQKSQVIKQPDVVALLALLPDEFAGATGAQNFSYYEPRCGHGSSLSRAMHGMVAARLGQSEMALRYFNETAAIDLGDTHVAIDGGVHIAALGGIWLTAVFGFAGLSLRREVLALEPRLPKTWLSLAFSLQWRGRHLHIRITQAGDEVEVTLEAGEPMSLVIRGETYRLLGDRPLRVVDGAAEDSNTETVG